MRQIVLDTETTGLNAKTGDRVIEIGCVEVINRRLTGNDFHTYINPERGIEEGALAVHGLTVEFLGDKPKFAEIVDAFRDYVRDAEIIIHNAPFDLGFLNAEFERLSLPSFENDVANTIDSLLLAREMHPGKRNSLDALCDRYGISNSHRTFHGALLDAALLAEVYLAMTRGQESLSMEITIEQPETNASFATAAAMVSEVLVLPASPEEVAAHEAFLDGLDKAVKGQCVWRT